MKAVFVHKASSRYDDLPEQHYHFPKTYLGQAERAIGDSVVYHEPRRTGLEAPRSGRQAYFAVARLRAIEQDPAHPDHYYAFVSDYLEFPNPVPFREGEHYYESALKRSDGGTSKGAFGRAVRLIPDDEFDLIFQSGFAHVLREEADSSELQGFAQEPETYERPTIETLIARPFRKRAFESTVKQAYADTCAMTGIKIINGGGRSEVQAAHIRPVADSGPDSVRNGIALCGTLHWMFDRGLVSIDDDSALLIAADRIPDTVSRLINPDGYLTLPSRTDWAPHPQFLKYHRKFVFKG